MEQGVSSLPDSVIAEPGLSSEIAGIRPHPPLTSEVSAEREGDAVVGITDILRRQTAVDPPGDVQVA